MDDYGDAFSAVQVHLVDDYQLSWGEWRADYYDVLSLPTIWVDGIDKQIGALDTEQENYDNLLTKLQKRWSVPTDVMIEMGGQEVSGPTYRITARVTLEETGQAKTVLVHMNQLLDHYPAGEEFRNCLKQAGPKWQLDLEPGQSEVVEAEFTFDAASWAGQENIRILMWAQEASASGPAEVYQSAVMSWPFAPLVTCPADVTGDAVVDVLDLLEILEQWGDSGGGGADITGDGMVDVLDLLEVLGAWGACA